MILKVINENLLLRRLISPFLDKWVGKKVIRITDFLNKDGKILDLGCGNCYVANKLIEKAYDITPVDIRDLSVVENITPIIFNGKKLPFANNTFETVLLLTVLHHSEDPIELISESKRVAKYVVIIEDTYKNNIQKFAVQFVDLIVNFGHSKMTYQNKKEEQWESIFNDIDLELLSKRRKSVLLFFQQTTYHLGK